MEKHDKSMRPIDSPTLYFPIITALHFFSTKERNPNVGTRKRTGGRSVGHGDDSADRGRRGGGHPHRRRHRRRHRHDEEEQEGRRVCRGTILINLLYFSEWTSWSHDTSREFANRPFLGDII